MVTPRIVPIALTLLSLLSHACVCQPPDDGSHGSSATAPPGEYGVIEEALRPDPKVDVLLTKHVTIPGTRWTARTPETWSCSSEGPYALECHAQDGRATYVQWGFARKPAPASLKDLMTATLEKYDAPRAERKVLRGKGVTGAFMRNPCLKAQCLDPVLVIYGPDAESGRDELTVVGNCDRTDCDLEMTVAVMYSTSRSE